MRCLGLVLALFLAGCNASPAAPIDQDPGEPETTRASVTDLRPPVTGPQPEAEAPRAPVTVFNQSFTFADDAPAMSFPVPSWAARLAVNVTESLTQPCYAAWPGNIPVAGPLSQPRITVTSPEGTRTTYEASSVLRCRMAPGPAAYIDENLTATPGNWQVQATGRGFGIALQIVVQAIDQ